MASTWHLAHTVVLLFVVTKVYVMYVFHGVAVAVVGVLWQQAWRQRDLHDIQHPIPGTLASPSERLLTL